MSVVTVDEFVRQDDPTEATLWDAYQTARLTPGTPQELVDELHELWVDHTEYTDTEIGDDMEELSDFLLYGTGA